MCADQGPREAHVQKSSRSPKFNAGLSPLAFEKRDVLHQAARQQEGQYDWAPPPKRLSQVILMPDDG